MHVDNSSVQNLDSILLVFFVVHVFRQVLIDFDLPCYFFLFFFKLVLPLKNTCWRRVGLSASLLENGI